MWIEVIVTVYPSLLFFGACSLLAFLIVLRAIKKADKDFKNDMKRRQS